MRERAQQVDGCTIRLTDLYKAFLAAIPSRDHPHWSKSRLKQELFDRGYQLGKLPDGRWHLANHVLTGSVYERGGDHLYRVAANP